MNKKCCLNCAYFSAQHVNLDDLISAAWIGHFANCRQEKWTLGSFSRFARRDGSGGYIRLDIHQIEEIIGDRVNLPQIPQAYDEWLDLSKHHCRDFFPEVSRGSMTMDKCWQEHQRQRQEAKDRYRFWIITGLSAATTAAVIASAIFHWLEWMGGEK